MKRILVAVVSAAFTLLPVAASADIQNLTIDSQVEFIDGNTVRVTGTITCDAGDNFRVGIPTGGLTTNLGTTSRRAGPVNGNCTGSAQTWRLLVQRAAGPAFQPGTTGEVTATAQTGTPGDTGPNDTEQATQAVTID